MRSHSVVRLVQYRFSDSAAGRSHFDPIGIMHLPQNSFCEKYYEHNKKETPIQGSATTAEMKLSGYIYCLVWTPCLILTSSTALSSLDCDAPSLPIEQLSFPEVLQQAGKTVFRPGGTEATNRLYEWASLPQSKDNKNENCRVLQMAAGVGGIQLAVQNGCHVLLLDKDAQKLRRVETLAKKKKIASRIETKHVDLAEESMNVGDNQFDAAMFEASLSQYPDSKKRQILNHLRQHTPQVLLHELGLRQDGSNAVKTVREVGKALFPSVDGQRNFSPLTVDGWKQLLQECGYRITHEEKGPLLTLSPKTMLADEGPQGTARIAFNLATHSDLRKRVLATKAVLASHSDTLGYILVRAVRDD